MLILMRSKKYSKNKKKYSRNKKSYKKVRSLSFRKTKYSRKQKGKIYKRKNTKIHRFKNTRKQKGGSRLEGCDIDINKFKDEKWLSQQLPDKRDKLNINNCFIIITNKMLKKNFIPQNDRITLNDWLEFAIGKKWLNSNNGEKWLSENGEIWLAGDDGEKWLKSEDGKLWLDTKDINEFLDSNDGEEWLDSEDSKEWLDSEDGKSWVLNNDLRRNDGKWLNSAQGNEWLNSDNGKKWLEDDMYKYDLTLDVDANFVNLCLSTEKGRLLLSTEKGKLWLDSDHSNEWLDSAHGNEWLAYNPMAMQQWEFSRLKAEFVGIFKKNIQTIYPTKNTLQIQKEYVENIDLIDKLFKRIETDSEFDMTETLELSKLINKFFKDNNIDINMISFIKHLNEDRTLSQIITEFYKNTKWLNWTTLFKKSTKEKSKICETLFKHCLERRKVEYNPEFPHNTIQSECLTSLEKYEYPFNFVCNKDSHTALMNKLSNTNADLDSEEKE